MTRDHEMHPMEAAATLPMDLPSPASPPQSSHPLHIADASPSTAVGRPDAAFGGLDRTLSAPGDYLLERRQRLRRLQDNRCRVMHSLARSWRTFMVELHQAADGHQLWSSNAKPVLVSPPLQVQLRM